MRTPNEKDSLESSLIMLRKNWKRIKNYRRVCSILFLFNFCIFAWVIFFFLPESKANVSCYYTSEKEARKGGAASFVSPCWYVLAERINALVNTYNGLTSDAARPFLRPLFWGAMRLTSLYMHGHKSRMVFLLLKHYLHSTNCFSYFFQTTCLLFRAL